MKIKVITLLSICMASFFSSFGQLRLDPFYPYSKWTVGIGVGTTQLYGDWPNSGSAAAFRLNIDRNIGPWVSIGLEGMRGGLSNYASKNKWTDGLSMNNTFTAVDLNAKLSLGGLFNAPGSFIGKTLFGIYIGAGVGYMWNDISNITMKFRHNDNLLITDYNEANIKTKSANLFFPLNLGLNLHVTKRCSFNINYQYNFCSSDYIDGYSFQQPTATNKYNDMFSVLSFGLHFYVGNVGNGRKGNYRTRH